MNLKEINKWWRSGMAKEQLRHTNAPKHHKGDKFSVATDISNFAQPLKPLPKRKAR